MYAFIIQSKTFLDEAKCKHGHVSLRCVLLFFSSRFPVILLTFCYAFKGRSSSYEYKSKSCE